MLNITDHQGTQINSTARHHLTPGAATKKQKPVLARIWGTWDAGAPLLWKTVRRFLKEQTQNYRVSSHSTCENVPDKTANRLNAFTAALCTTAKRWKPPKCPSTAGWVRKGHPPHSGLPGSPTREKTDTCCNTDEPRGHCAQQISQVQKDKSCMIPHQAPGGSTLRDTKQEGGGQGWGRE